MRTWLTGILKHKIIDHLRRQAREHALGETDSEADPQSDIVSASFDEDGHWHEFPADWGAPDRSLESKQFWTVFEMCVQVMPARTARVFVMREVLELSTEEICKELGITATNCWVMLHRARFEPAGLPRDEVVYDQMRLIPTLQGSAELLSQAQDRPLTLREKLVLYVHLPLCDGCRNFKAQLAFMRRTLREYIERS